MSDRLAISASFSVLMMSIYVLFGDNVAHMPLGPSQLASETEFGGTVEVPGPLRSPGEFLQLVK